MLFTATLVILLGVVSAAPLARQNEGESGIAIVAGDSAVPTNTKCLAVRGGANVTLADGLAVEL